MQEGLEGESVPHALNDTEQKMLRCCGDSANICAGTTGVMIQELLDWSRCCPCTDDMKRVPGAAQGLDIDVVQLEKPVPAKDERANSI